MFRIDKTMRRFMATRRFCAIKNSITLTAFKTSANTL